MKKLPKLRCYASKFSTDITVPMGRKNQQKHLNRVGGFLNSLKLLTRQREYNITFFNMWFEKHCKDFIFF